MGAVVVPVAEADGVVEVGGAAVLPSFDVVGVEPGGVVAPFGRAASVADLEGEALGFAEESALAAEVEGLGGTAEDGGDDPGLAGQPAGHRG